MAFIKGSLLVLFLVLSLNMVYAAPPYIQLTDSLGDLGANGLSLPDLANAAQCTGLYVTATNSPDVFTITSGDGIDISNVVVTPYSPTSCTAATGSGDDYTFSCTGSATLLAFLLSYSWQEGSATGTDSEKVYLGTSSSSGFPQGCTPATVGDPQFRGFRGQSYQIHGMDGVYYNLITSELTQVNAKFNFLDEGKCPIINGVPSVNCWSHPGSYMGALGIQRIVDGVNQQMMIEAGAAERGFASIVFNNAQVKLGESSTIGSFSFNYTSSHSIIVETGNFTLMVDNSDGFVNQAVKVNIPLSQLTSHGLLGQTHSSKIYPSQFKYIEADVDDYAVSGLFENDFVFNQFSA